MKGGCWDASAFAEEAKGILEDWLRGLLTDREAPKVAPLTEAILQAARENNFSPEELGGLEAPREEGGR